LIDFRQILYFNDDRKKIEILYFEIIQLAILFQNSKISLHCSARKQRNTLETRTHLILALVIHSGIAKGPKFLEILLINFFEI